MAAAHGIMGNDRGKCCLLYPDKAKKGKKIQEAKLEA
jgi:hypothetical protein